MEEGAGARGLPRRSRGPLHYSVPYQLVGQSLDVRISTKTVECFAKSKRVASHVRSLRRGAHTTQAEHMPRAHRDYAQWTPQRLVRWAQQTGPSVAGLIEMVLATRVHPQQGFRSCLGILRLGQRFGPERLEAACLRALSIGATSYRSVRSILETRPPPDLPTPVGNPGPPATALPGFPQLHTAAATKIDSEKKTRRKTKTTT